MDNLTDVIRTASPRLRAHPLSIGGGETVTLAFVATDYVHHQLHHLGQVWERAEA